MFSSIVARGCAGAAILAMAVVAHAYPDKPVSYVIPFAPGGESDFAARIQQQAFRTKYNQEMIVSNKGGAGGALAWSQLNAMPGDGYTIMGVNLPHIVLQPLEPGTQFRTEDITPVYFFHYTPDALIVPADSPYRTFADLVKAARDKPDSISLAGSGTNSANHLAHERLDRELGIKTLYVPFKGTGDLVSAVLGNHVTGAMAYSTLAVQQKGKMRMLAVAHRKTAATISGRADLQGAGVELGRRRLSRHRRSKIHAAGGSQDGLGHDGRSQQGP